MQAFRYQTPASVADARAAAAAGAKFMAGGQSLLPSMRLGMSQPEALADLSGLPGMAGITVSGGVVRVGAMTTHAQVAASAEVQTAIRALVSRGAQAYTIGSRSYTALDLGRLTARESQLKAIVAREKAAERVAAGLGDSRDLFVRF